MRKRNWFLVAALALQASSAAIADPLQGGATLNQTLPGAGDSSYPAPVMVQPQIMRPQTPVHATPPKPKKPLNANINENVQRQPPPPQRPPMQLNATQVALPAGFLGSWRVMGQRSKVEAMPEFQAGAEQAFSLNTNNTWNIQGQPGSYSMSNGEMSTPLWVDKVEGGTAFIRYQHQIKNTMAQEAIVLSLGAGGAQFNGLERISIVKEGLAQPRAKVTYQLAGSRLR
ncbi:MAG TPA: hypothetical protein V6C76_07980 [Drouetiella sp.]